MFPELIHKEINEKVEETYTMTDYRQEDQNTHHAGGNHHHGEQDDDEHEEGQHFGGGNGMRCEHQ